MIVYYSDMLHAGPDNRLAAPRYFFNMNIAREAISRESWQGGYTPHSSLLAAPITLDRLTGAKGSNAG